MKIDFKIQAFLVEPQSLKKRITDNIKTWGNIENLYTVTEPIEIADELVGEIIEELKMKAAPRVYLKYIDGEHKWSPLKEIHHKIEVEHWKRFKDRLVTSGRFTYESRKKLTDRFHIMVSPAFYFWLDKDDEPTSSELTVMNAKGDTIIVDDCWNNIKDKLYKDIDGKQHFLGFVQFDNVLEKDEYIFAWRYADTFALHYEIKHSTQVIDKDAFKLWDIEEATIPESVEKIIGNPFADSKYHTRYISNIISHSSKFIAENGILYEKLDDDTKRLIYSFDKNIKMVVDPDVSVIEEKAFKDCYFLETIDFPNVKTIGRKAFQNCTGLLNIELGDKWVTEDCIAGTFDCWLYLHTKPVLPPHSKEGCEKQDVKS